MYRGRKIGVPRGDRVRPTQDRVREALFSMLRAELPGACFLDLYAGTGAVGIEALSRGAAQVGQAVSLIDQATQQNAAMVEESAAAAESLKDQARQLVQSVAVFRLAH